jgi:hypothetical protein
MQCRIATRIGTGAICRVGPEMASPLFGLVGHWADIICRRILASDVLEQGQAKPVSHSP